MTIYSLDVLLSQFGKFCSFVPCPVLTCFLTCTQIPQEAGQVVWYSHLLQNFPRFIVIHTVKGFGIVNRAEIVIFLELSCFFDLSHLSALTTLECYFHISRLYKLYLIDLSRSKKLKDDIWDWFIFELLFFSTVPGILQMFN